VKELTRKIQGCGHKLYMNNYFSSPDLYRDLTKQKINCCGTVRPNHKRMPDDFRSKILKLKRGEVRVRTSGDMTALVWKDKRDVYCTYSQTFTIHQQKVTFVMRVETP
jgi:hypothetical protein